MCTYAVIVYVRYTDVLHCVILETRDSGVGGNPNSYEASAKPTFKPSSRIRKVGTPTYIHMYIRTRGGAIVSLLLGYR